MIGNTPLLPIRVELLGRAHPVWLKLEGENPFGSIKDRTAYGLLLAVERAAPSGAELTVVESTSGNLGAALAALCRLRGHRFVAVVDPLVSPRNLDLMRQYGARIEMVARRGPDHSYLTARLDRVQQLRAADPGMRWTDQYANPANPEVHFRQTAPEIARQAGPGLRAVFVAASTGGTLAGVARYFHSAGGRVSVLGVDALGSAALGGELGRRELTGHGASRRTAFADAALRDGTVRIGDAAAVAACRKLAADTGLALGGSGGAALAACVRHLCRTPEPGVLVCLCPDYGVKYQDSIYADHWVRAHDIALGQALAGYAELGLRFALEFSRPAT